MKYGVDISRHQSADAVEQLHRGGKADFIILRSSFGTYTEDDKFKQYIKDSERLGLKNSIYHAAYAGTVAEAIEEADFCCDTLEKYGYGPEDLELPICYDYEYFSANYNAGRGIATTPQLVQALTTAFCERIKERGYKAGVYYNLDYYQRFYGKAYFEAHPDYWRWYARPGLSAPDLPCDIWQYASDSGAEYGYSGAIDKNILYSEYIDGEVEVMQPLSPDPVRLIIGFATAGDIGTLTTYINGLGIGTKVKDGYIITDVPVSKGDQCYIVTAVNKLGNIDCVIYEEPQAECAECEKLKEEIAELKKQLDEKQLCNDGFMMDVLKLTEEKERLETALKHEQEACNAHIDDNVELVALVDNLQAENASLKEQLEAEQQKPDANADVLQEKLTAANRALSEQKRLNSELITAIKPLREQLDKIKEIVKG